MEIGVVLLICAITGLLILQPFRQASTGFLVGLVLGPWGVVIAVIHRSDLRRNEQIAQHREIVYLLRRGTDERIERAAVPQ